MPATWVIQQLLHGDLSAKRLARLKRRAALRFGQKLLPTSALLAEYHKLTQQGKIKPSAQLGRFLTTRRVRTLSGVATVTVLTKPYPCPGHCLYCPSEPDMPKSYLKNEPAAARAFMFGFNPYRQVQTRLGALQATGHRTDKIELIVLGGTWSAYPENYQYWFIAECFRAANEAGAKSEIINSKKQIPKDKTALKKQLKKEQKKNERAKNRLVGLTLETRPDYINLNEIKKMRVLGCTRIELGVQSIDNLILKINKRGHSVKQTTQATLLLKNAGFKINYHLMLNLPGSGLCQDLAQFKKVFTDQNFQPDLLKIYPCSVLRTAPLYKIYKQGKYRPYAAGQLQNLLLRIKQIIPPHVRIQRIIRDIPKESIVAGSEISNLRQVLQREMAAKNLRCQCIRCREIKETQPAKKIKLVRRDYQASGAREIFLSFEDAQKNLYALLRLRLPENHPTTLPVLQNAALIRELHTYGQLAPLKQKGAVQHKGLGKKLMRAAEKITKKETNSSKIAVIAGVGVRDYYRHLGYRLQNSYMVKKIR